MKYTVLIFFVCSLWACQNSSSENKLIPGEPGTSPVSETISERNQDSLINQVVTDSTKITIGPHNVLISASSTLSSRESGI